LTGDFNNEVAGIAGQYAIDEPGKEFAGLSLRGLPYILVDSECDPRTADVVEWYRGAKIRAMIAVPLHKTGCFVAGMAVHQTVPRQWRSEEVELVHQVASRSWEAIERARMAEELRDSEGRFRQLANAVPAFAWITLPNGQLTYMNERWYDYTGLSADGSLGFAWRNTLHPEDRERVLAVWREATEREIQYAVECRYLGADGLYRWFMARALPVRDAAGRVSQWFGTSTDIHEAKRAEEALRKANSDLEQFAYSASHDLKEPLRMLSVYSQILQRKYKDKLDKEAEEYLTYLTQAAKRMDMLVQDLLGYTQAVKFGDDEITPVATNEILSRVFSNLKEAIRESGANITVGKLPPALFAKDAHLVQLFQNIIGNAIKYRGDMPLTVTISAESSGDTWKVCVHDNGIGIDPKYAKQVFGIFKRLHTAEKYPGTGIGLAICEKIVHQYGGRIWVESEGEGRGSTFCFTLPGGKDIE
jgi:PAS domain S-box-containing protein